MVSKKKTTKKAAPKSAWKGYTKPEIIRKPRFIPPNNFWLPQFEAVYHFGVHGKGHGSINAVAGSGKTTALVELAYRYIEAFPHHKVLCIAFNSSIRTELQSRMPIGTVQETCHSFGYKSVIRVWGDGKYNNFELQGPKGFVVKNLAEAVIGYEKEKEDDRDALCQAVSLAKTRLATNIEEVIEVMDYWGIESTLKKEEFAKHVLWVMNEMKQRPGTGSEKGKKAITYDDQVWLPIVNGWAPAEQYDLVLVDEAQDLSPARKEIARRSLKPGGRMIVVGDPKQAIYNFAGADIHALPDMTEELKATILPLTCSFRCGKNIIKEAQQINSIIEAAPDAIDGIVDTMKPDDLIKKAKAGDAIISRTNAPLVKIFFKLAKKGVKVKMLGKDYGGMLSMRVSSWAKKAKKKGEVFTGSDLLAKNDEWLEEQIEYLTKKKMDTNRAADEHETVSAFCSDLSCKLNTADAVKEVLERINNMFSKDEEPGKDDGKYFVTLSSTHKFKGLERERVFLLRDTYRPGNGEEEDNLLYVGISRARSHLTYVRGKFQE